MKITVFLFFALCTYVISAGASVIDDQLPGQGKSELIPGDTYEADDKQFKCPLPFGAFSDPDDCSYFYVCVAGISVHRKCKTFLKFDILRRTCVPGIMAICGSNNNKDKTTDSSKKTTKSVTATTPSGDSFTCPSWVGTFPHPTDCSKYYTCMLYQASLKTCPKSQLFDAVKKSCKPADKVNCGDRNRPDSTTTLEIVTESATPTEDITSAETPTDTDATITESSSTTVAIIPTEAKPTGPPETDCDKDDVDCIIDETGDPDNWFTCPEDIGAYVHPSSNKLFIFCMNWIPSVKKCGMDLVFSEELSTCIEVEQPEDEHLL